MNKVDDEQNPSGQAVSSPHSALSGRELDVAVAGRVMDVPFECKHDARGWCYRHGGRACVPAYSTDIAAAMEVENRIAELGLQQDYIEALESDIAVWYEANADDKFRLVHATPEQRCRAALAAHAATERETES